jgi:hypothetical protein
MSTGESKSLYLSHGINDIKQSNHHSSRPKGEKISKREMVYRSTKNLYGAVNREKLLDEINGINDTLNKMDKIKKRNSKLGSQILEDTLISNSSRS